MVATQDYIWEQGDDLVVDITYQINGEPVDLTAYSVRMDIAPLVGGLPSGSPVFSFNSDDFPDGLDTTGDNDNEIILSAEGEIHIVVPRSLTLPNGIIGNALETHAEYGYDLFLRDPLNKQKKLLQGKILVRKSITKWA